MLQLTENVVSVACMLDEPERHELEFYDRVRAETLRRLVAMPSYECKNLRWKNIWYDFWKRKVIREMREQCE